MQTQCPHCKTRFRVTQSQVDTADGYVRCSVCKEVFNALSVAEQHVMRHSLLSQTHAEDTPDDAMPDSASDDTLKSAPDTTVDTDDEQADEQTPGKSDLDTPALNQASTTARLQKDAYDFFDEDANESLPHVVPESFKEPYPGGAPGLLPGLLWGAGILLLTATLFIEYAWFNRDQLNRIPQLKAWTEKLCRHIECKDISMRAPEKIELVSRNVYSHPSEKNALMVNVTMKNTADFAQPYPIMQVNFSDVRGGDVAARRFRPGEYLPEDIQSIGSEQLLLFEPGTNLTFSMEIKDPGKQAMTYEFNFL